MVSWIRLSLVVIAGGISGCGLLGFAGGDAQAAGPSEPEWVARGSAYAIDGDTRSFVGVGAARGELNASLLRAAARKRATGAVKHQLEDYLDQLAKPWVKSLSPKIKEQANPRGMLASLTKRLEPRIHIEDTYVAGSGRAAFVQARLELIAVLMEMEASADTEPMRAYLGSKGLDPKNLFDHLASGGGEEGEE